MNFNITFLPDSFLSASSLVGGNSTTFPGIGTVRKKRKKELKFTLLVYPLGLQYCKYFNLKHKCRHLKKKKKLYHD